jgi:aconitate hydratase
MVYHTRAEEKAMPQNLVEKIISSHLAEGEMKPGEEIGLRIDQTLTQDATGTMAYLEFEAMGIPRVRTKLSVSYVDHNMLQEDFRNADDHLFLQSAAAKYGVYFSRPGNGICHQVHLERFAAPGQTLLGSDSHTPTAGGMGMLASGAGGLDVAAAMAGYPFYLAMPKIVLVRLRGSLPPWVAAKDVILELLRRLTVKGGVGRAFEYGGEAVRQLTVPERATICNMGAELGATGSVFPSDEQTLSFLRAQAREKAWQPLQPDDGASYDEVVELDLSSLEPLIAWPHSPDNVKPVRELEGTKVHQVAIGSCTNSSYVDLMRAVAILRGKTIAPGVSLAISPGSRQVLEQIARDGALADLISSGARILESSCGPCIGMGLAPPSGGLSIRSFNRNFEGRSGTPDAQVCLASAEVCAAAALKGVITDPRSLGEMPSVQLPEKFIIDDRMIIPPPPAEETEKVQVVRGPNIRPLPPMPALEDVIEGEVILAVGDNITTDHILPAGARILPLRSNIPAISEHVFERVDPTFPKRIREASGGIVVGGLNYGQGSSREHAALAPRSLGLRAVIAKSFARIHRANLVNFGILPLTFADERDADQLKQGHRIRISSVRRSLEKGEPLEVENLATGRKFAVRHDLAPRQVKMVLAGGLLNAARGGAQATSTDGAGGKPA